jgi:surface polysaccharide O-acyltransferase-like enzyme
VSTAVACLPDVRNDDSSLMFFFFLFILPSKLGCHEMDGSGLGWLLMLYNASARVALPLFVPMSPYLIFAKLLVISLECTTKN